MTRQALVLVIVVLIFGVLVPWYRGITLLQPVIVMAYALMALLFVAPAASEFWFAIPSPASAGSVLSRMVAIIGYGWGITIVMLATAMITLNLANRSARVIIPPWGFLTAVLVLSLTASAAVAVACAILARRFSAATAKAAVRAIFLLTLFVLAFGSRVLPESWQITLADHSTRRALTKLAWQGSGLCAAAALIGIVLLLRSPDSESEPASP